MWYNLKEIPLNNIHLYEREMSHFNNNSSFNKTNALTQESL